MADKATGGSQAEHTPQYMPKNGNDTAIDLAVLRTELVHGFKHLDKRLSKIEDRQKEQQSDIEGCKRDLAILQATALRIDAIRISATVGVTVTVILGLATVITKVAGLW